jgi:hypothetical protein
MQEKENNKVIVQLNNTNKGQQRACLFSRRVTPKMQFQLVDSFFLFKFNQSGSASLLSCFHCVVSLAEPLPLPCALYLHVLA